MLVTAAVRALQLVFAATVLSISSVLIKGFGGPGKGPALHEYGAFCSGAGLIIAAIGVAALFVEPLQGVIILALDALATLFVLAGGIAFAATIKVGSCTDFEYLGRNEKTFTPGQHTDLDTAKKISDSFTYRCRMTQADTAILWFLFATFAVTTVLHFVSKRSRGASII